MNYRKTYAKKSVIMRARESKSKRVDHVTNGDISDLPHCCVRMSAGSWDESLRKFLIHRYGTFDVAIDVSEKDLVEIENANM